jgi:hypothetical protein
MSDELRRQIEITRRLIAETRLATDVAKADIARSKGMIARSRSTLRLLTEKLSLLNAGPLRPAQN